VNIRYDRAPHLVRRPL